MHLVKQVIIPAHSFFILWEERSETIKVEAFLCFSVDGWCREKATLFGLVRKLH